MRYGSSKFRRWTAFASHTIDASQLVAGCTVVCLVVDWATHAQYGTLLTSFPIFFGSHKFLHWEAFFSTGMY